MITGKVLLYYLRVNIPQGPKIVNSSKRFSILWLEPHPFRSIYSCLYWQFFYFDYGPIVSQLRCDHRVTVNLGKYAQEICLSRVVVAAMLFFIDYDDCRAPGPNEFVHVRRAHGGVNISRTGVFWNGPHAIRPGLSSAFGNWNVRRKCPAIMYGGKFHVRREYRVATSSSNSLPLPTRSLRFNALSYTFSWRIALIIRRRAPLTITSPFEPHPPVSLGSQRNPTHGPSWGYC